MLSMCKYSNIVDFFSREIFATVNYLTFSMNCASQVHNLGKKKD